MLGSSGLGLAINALMLLACVAIYAYHLLSGLWLNKNVISSLIWLKQRQSELHALTLTSSDRFPFIIILLPMLREQAVIERCLKQFLTINYPHNKIRVVVITTEIETIQRNTSRALVAQLAADIQHLPEQELLARYTGVFPRTSLPTLIKQARTVEGAALKAWLNDMFDSQATTMDLADDLIKQLNTQVGQKMFYHLHYPDTNKGRVYQLNYALARIPALIDNLEQNNSYVGIYDADALVDVNTLHLLAADFASDQLGGADAYQHGAVYCSNLSDLPSTFEGTLQKCEGIIQTRWSLGFEIPLWRRYAAASVDPQAFLVPLAYCVGHGSFFRLATLQRLGLFPDHTPGDDIATGHMFSFLGYRIKPLPIFDLSEVVPSVPSWIKQGSLWFSGSKDVIQTWRQTQLKGLPMVSRRQQYWMIIDGVSRNLAWAGRPGAFLCALLLNIFVFPYPWLLILGVAAFSTYGPLGALVVFLSQDRINEVSIKQKNLKRLGWSELIGVLFASPVNYVLRCFGPCLYLLRTLSAHLQGERQIEFQKTER